MEVKKVYRFVLMECECFYPLRKDRKMSSRSAKELPSVEAAQKIVWEVGTFQQKISQWFFINTRKV